MSITIIGAGLGGLIVGSGGTYLLLNPRINQAEAEASQAEVEKAALAEQLRTVTEQLRQLQDQVAELQQQVKLPSPSSVEPMALPSQGTSVSAGEFPLPLPPNFSETSPTATSLADRNRISGATAEMPTTAESSPLTDEVSEWAIAGWPEAPDLSSAAALEASIEATPTIPELAAIDEAEASLHPMDAISSSQASGGLELGSSDLQQADVEPEWLIPEDHTLDSAVSTTFSMDRSSQELPDHVAESPLDLLPLHESSQRSQIDGSSPSESPLVQAADPFKCFDLGLDPEATWVHSEADFPEVAPATLSTHASSHSPARESLPSAKSAEPLLASETPAAKPSKSFNLGLDPEATWVHSEPDFPEVTAAHPLAAPSHKSPSGTPEAVIPVIDFSQESDTNPFSLGVDPEATWVHPETEH